MESEGEKGLRREKPDREGKKETKNDLFKKFL